MARILIVEDEERIASFVAKGLGRGPPRRPSWRDGEPGSTRP